MRGSQLDKVRNTNYCQQGQGLWAVSLTSSGPLEEKLAIEESNTALGPKTEVTCVGPALVRKALAFVQIGRFLCIWPRLLAGEGGTQVPGLTLESRTSRAAVVIGMIWSMERGGREKMGFPSTAWSGYLDTAGVERKGSTCPRPRLQTWEAQLGPHLAHQIPTEVRLGHRGLLCCTALIPHHHHTGLHQPRPQLRRLSEVAEAREAIMWATAGPLLFKSGRQKLLPFPWASRTQQTLYGVGSFCVSQPDTGVVGQRPYWGRKRHIQGPFQIQAFQME